MNHVVRRQLVPKLTRQITSRVNAAKKEISDTDRIINAINDHSKELSKSLFFIQLAVLGVQMGVILK